MGYAEQNAAFLDDKNKFFAQLRTEKAVETKIKVTDELLKEKEYVFLLQNQITLESEFVHMFAVLKKSKDENNEAFWMYCYYSASLLEAFYNAYEQASKKEEYSKLKQQIKNRLLNIKQEEKAAEESFIQSLENSFVNSFSNLARIPFHVSILRDYAAYSNLCRVYWVFCRLTLVTGFAFAENLHLFDKLDAVLGTHTDVNKIIQTLQAPNGVLNYFSVGLFLIRFVIDGGMLLKHTFFPSPEEKKSKDSALERFKYELYKRHCNFTNDLVWATVNFLTNFNQLTGLSGPAAGALTVVFLGFDMCMFIYKLHLAKQEYKVKEAQYLEELKNLEFLTLSPDERDAHEKQLKDQLAELEISWKTKQSTFYFAASAAALLTIGFSTALIFSPPGIILASFFMGTFAVAMYLSIGAYSKYTEKSLRLDQANLPVDRSLAIKEYEAARNDFIFTLVKNTVMPTLLIATFAVCWPAAIALTVVYLGYEIFHSYGQHNSSKEVAQLALDSPKADVEIEEENCCFSF